MKRFALDNMVRGWFVGNFDPSAFRTNDFEVGVKRFKKGDLEQAHYHKVATEITLVVSGKVKMGNQILVSGDIICISPNEVCDFYALEDATIVVVKTKSIVGDKYAKLDR